MNGWGPSDDSFATKEAIIKDAIEWARLSLLNSSSNNDIYCLDCGEEIPERRRQIIKNCNYCCTCQESHDIITTSYYNRRGSKDSQLR
ncbi:DksA-like zinc-finger protein [Proteus phage phiP4-3]|uniref:Zinc finger DksA/TraR C4-type domain-containing protein n=1 Tax=Proteus phage phiP4-3 TaxID=2065203 RepID=A0A2I6PFQ8_9CAUD|nr:DksA-like zinc-finger protein [Proteus phage phiP4-3]AUM58544.1 hypothetical protein phiP43_186 [Proteus phage phiP4-3]AZV01215.1 hypothetical protein vBSdyM006_078 [Shigella phage vB_SdyM_006]